MEEKKFTLDDIVELVDTLRGMDGVHTVYGKPDYASVYMDPDVFHALLPNYKISACWIDDDDGSVKACHSAEYRGVFFTCVLTLEEAKE